MDAEKLEKAKAGLKACANSIMCGENCPYEEIHNNPDMGNCISLMARDALEAIKELEKKARAGGYYV